MKLIFSKGTLDQQVVYLMCRTEILSERNNNRFENDVRVQILKLQDLYFSSKQINKK